MLQHPRKLIVLSLVVVAAIVVAPQAGAAAVSERHPLDITLRAEQTGSTFSGSLTGTEGDGSARVTSQRPKVAYRMRFANGLLNVTSVGGRLHGTKVTSTFRILGGTKKYKGATGQGKLTGDTQTGIFRFVGTISYQRD